MAHHRRLPVVALCAASVLALAGCAATAGSGGDSGATDARPGSSFGLVWPAPPEGEVIAQGTVIDVDGDVDLCLGAVAESYPPQCSGIPITNWAWDVVQGYETSSGVTWGAYAVVGSYDGEEFTVTQEPIMLALYDPMTTLDPTGGEPGEGDETTLLEIQEGLPSILGDAYLGSYPENGWLWVDVVWDDGTWQVAADDDYGDRTVVIRSALRELGG